MINDCSLTGGGIGQSRSLIENCSLYFSFRIVDRAQGLNEGNMDGMVRKREKRGCLCFSIGIIRSE